MSSAIDPSCWICGEPATTGEHFFKHSDLKQIFGQPSQAAPLFHHSAKRVNRPVGSLKANVLKMPKILCAPCNNERSQPYDRAWESLSGWLRAKVNLRPGDQVRGDRVWPDGHASRRLRNVQLYFTKLTGCYLTYLGVPFDQRGMAKSLLHGTISPHIHIRLRANNPGDVGLSDIVVDDSHRGRCTIAAWLYLLGRLAVEVQYVDVGRAQARLPGAWHPRAGSNRLQIMPSIDEQFPA